MTASLIFYSRLYRAQLRNSLVVQFQYRVAMGIWMIGLILEPLIYLSVWTSVASSSGGSVGSFTGSDFAGYYIVMLVVQHFTMIWHMWEYDYIIRQGQFSARLLRPFHPIHTDAAQNIAYKLLMLAVVIPAVIILVLTFRPTVNPSLWAFIAFFPALILAGVLAFVMGWALAMAAFWTTRIVAINQTYFIATFFFSGQLAPLELLPEWIRTLSGLLPFRWFVSFPVELMLGRLTVEQTLTGFVAQSIWIGIGVMLMHFLYRAGIKRYVAFGG